MNIRIYLLSKSFVDHVMWLLDLGCFKISSIFSLMKHVYLCGTTDASSFAAKQPSDKSIVKKEKKNYHGWENIGEKYIFG